ncbi:MAG: sigma-70 family RNA polymerase sigma factor, partial [Acetobacteraceae bacterium]|nr:sigma-70 family RNA polymerase sigma factor [Acetobacteraceae bacterium]
MTELLPELRAFARFLVRDRSEADDLVQEALVRALGALAQFQQGTSLRAWLFTIVRNAFYEQARRRRTEKAALERVGMTEQASAP